MKIEDEIQMLPKIASIGLALIAFTRTLHPGDFRREGRSWIYRPDNFVTFDIHYQRTENITLSLRGRPIEFPQTEILNVVHGMGYGAYSRCKITRVDQLDIAAICIRRALELYSPSSSFSKTADIPWLWRPG